MSSCVAHVLQCAARCLSKRDTPNKGAELMCGLGVSVLETLSASVAHVMSSCVADDISSCVAHDTSSCVAHDMSHSRRRSDLKDLDLEIYWSPRYIFCETGTPFTQLKH